MPAQQHQRLTGRAQNLRPCARMRPGSELRASLSQNGFLRRGRASEDAALLPAATTPISRLFVAAAR